MMIRGILILSDYIQIFCFKTFWDHVLQVNKVGNHIKW